MRKAHPAYIVLLLTAALLLITADALFAASTPVTTAHINEIRGMLTRSQITKGYVELDQYGRIELKGEYADEKEVDTAFSLAQTVVGVKWVSPVTP